MAEDPDSPNFEDLTAKLQVCTAKDLAKNLGTTESVFIYAARKAGIPLLVDYDKLLENLQLLREFTSERTKKYSNAGLARNEKLSPEKRLSVSLAGVEARRKKRNQKSNPTA